MRVVYVGIWRQEPKPVREVALEYDLSFINRFGQKSALQVMQVFIERVVSKAEPGTRAQTIEEESGSKYYTYADRTGVCGVVVTDSEYPIHVASSLVGKITDDFTKKYPRTAYATFANETDRLQLPELKDYIKKYQDPAQADNITKIQKELDDTHAVLKNTMSSLLERGEKLDDLVAKSEGLSTQSKMFYTQAKKQNSCCIVM